MVFSVKHLSIRFQRKCCPEVVACTDIVLNILVLLVIACVDSPISQEGKIPTEGQVPMYMLFPGNHRSTRE